MIAADTDRDPRNVTDKHPIEVHKPAIPLSRQANPAAEHLLGNCSLPAKSSSKVTIELKNLLCRGDWLRGAAMQAPFKDMAQGFT